MRNFVIALLGMFVVISDVGISSGFVGISAVKRARYYEPFFGIGYTVTDINHLYMKTMFKEFQFDKAYYSETEPDVFIVAFRYINVVVNTEMEEISSPAIQVALEQVAHGEPFDFEWEVDLQRDIVRPYNAAAKDSLILFRQMHSLFGDSFKQDSSVELPDIRFKDNR